MFRKWLNSNQRRTGKTPAYIELYDRILKSSTFSETQIKKGIFKSTKSFIKGREALIEKLVTCFSSSQIDSSPGFSMVKAALELNAIEYASKIFQEEYSRACQEEQFAYAMLLVDFRDKIFQDFGFSLGKGEESISFTKLRRIHQSIFHLSSLYEEARGSTKKERTTKQKLSGKIASVLAETSPQTKQEEYLVYRLKMIAKILEEDYLSSNEIQLVISNSVFSRELVLRPGQYLRELSLGIISALWAKNKSLAMKYTFALSSFEPGNLLEESQKDRVLTLRQIEIGNVFFDPDHIVDGLEKIHLNKDLFQASLLQKYLYFSAYSLFCIGRFSESKKVLNEVRQFPNGTCIDLKWQPDFLRLLCDFNDPDVDHWQYILASVQRTVNASGNSFPKAALQAVQELRNASESGVPHLVGAKHKKILRDLTSSSEAENRESKLLNVGDWISSVVEKKNLSEIIIRKSPETNKAGRQQSEA